MLMPNSGENLHYFCQSFNKIVKIFKYSIDARFFVLGYNVWTYFLEQAKQLTEPAPLTTLMYIAIVNGAILRQLHKYEPHTLFHKSMELFLSQVHSIFPRPLIFMVNVICSLQPPGIYIQTSVVYPDRA